jgi:hypothetical protein
MTPEQWSLSANPKASGTWNLHRFLPKELDFFVMLSSSLGILGGRGQANYNAGMLTCTVPACDSWLM